MKARQVVVLAALAAVASAATAADRVKIGFISTLSGPNATVGVDIRDGFNLALKLAGGKLGGLPAEVIVLDDQLNPEMCSHHPDRVLTLDRIHLLTGVVCPIDGRIPAPMHVRSKTC